MKAITNETILKDIEGFNRRIKKAKSVLNELPVETYGWAAQKNLDKKRRDLVAEIEHCERLIAIAESGLQDKE